MSGMPSAFHLFDTSMGLISLFYTLVFCLCQTATTGRYRTRRSRFIKKIYMPQNVSLKRSLQRVNREFDRRVAYPKTGAKNFDVIPLSCHAFSIKKICMYLKHVSFQASVLFILNCNSLCLRHLCSNRYYICSDKHAANSVLTQYTRNDSNARITFFISAEGWITLVNPHVPCAKRKKNRNCLCQKSIVGTVSNKSNKFRNTNPFVWKQRSMCIYFTPQFI